MKSIISFLFIIIVSLNVHAHNIDEMKIGSNSKTASLEIKIKSTLSNHDVVITVKDEQGNIITTQAAKVITGETIISIVKPNTMKEGMYTVEMKSGDEIKTAKFMIWN
ncbi:hypothetical protein ACFOWM_07020 [Ferruginibacter yonginensis]|uniref:DUF3244 domain-containing protein n=1 Tax=Ferruginibacter yonginensis TaxID=1310416 RepID=A0ABV8QQY7_9BACT